MARVKKAPIVVLAATVLGIGGFLFASHAGLLAPAPAGSSAVPIAANLPQLVESSAPAAPVALVASAGKTPATVAGPQIRLQGMAWNAHMALNGANGGPVTTEGSLMQKHGVNLKLIREDDVGKMGTQLINFATSLKKGNAEPTEGAHFMSVMGDGSAATIAGMISDLRKIGMDPEVIGSGGYSRGEDKLMGPPAWKQNPKLIMGSLVSGYLRDGDWNIALKFAGDNGIKNNPDEKTYDPEAVNWYSADDFLKAAEAYNNNVCEDRPVVHNGKRTGETKHVCVDSVVTWTPGDVNIAENRGGLASIVSTKDYNSQMPMTIIGIKQWDQAHADLITEMLEAMFEEADQIKSYPAALTRASEATWEVFNKEQSPQYWEQYFKGLIKADKTGLQVDLGGSSVNNLQDNLQLYGLTPGSANLFAATYTIFGNIVKQQYPKLVPNILPVEQVLNTQYVLAAQKKYGGQAAGKADIPVYQATTAVTQPLGDRDWNINFDTGKATFSQGSMKQLQELRDGLLMTRLIIEIHGYTDNTGDPIANKALSQARAEAVRNWLMQQSSDRFSRDRFAKVEGHGQDGAIATNETESGRAKNRRVQVIIGH